MHHHSRLIQPMHHNCPLPLACPHHVRETGRAQVRKITDNNRICDRGQRGGSMCGVIGALTCILNVHITPKNGIQRSATATQIQRISSNSPIRMTRAKGGALDAAGSSCTSQARLSDMAGDDLQDDE